MSTMQKLGLGAFPTLNIWLIAIAIVRGALAKARNGTYDVTWSVFASYLEPNVAILAACFPVFCSVFVENDSKVRRRQARPQKSSQRRLYQEPSTEQTLVELPAVPKPMLSAKPLMIWKNNRTNIHRGENEDANAYTFFEESLVEEESDAILERNIHITYDWTVESTTVSPPFSEFKSGSYI